MYYKYGVVVIDLELGMFLEYSRIGSCIGNYYKKCMTTKTPKKAGHAPWIISEYFIAVINVHLIMYIITRTNDMRVRTVKRSNELKPCLL